MASKIQISLASLSIIVLVITILLLASCESKKKRIDTSGNITPKVTHSVIIYGSENCDHCIEFRQKMDSARLAYEFKDAEASDRNYQELLLKIQQANFKGYVSFPVLDIDGDIYVRPNFADVVRMLEK